MTTEPNDDEAPETRVFSTAIPPVVQRVLDEESLRRRHIVIALSGAHAYGFPSPDSDYDLKSVHAAEASSLFGLHEAKVTFDRMEVIQGVEVDYTSNELQGVLAGLLKGNGNYFERFLGPILLRTSPELFELQPIVRGVLSRRVFHHYRGFASGQRKELEKPEGRTAKKLLYVLRTALTGAHLLSRREMITDLSLLIDEHGMGEVRSLIDAKRAGERTPLSDAELTRWTPHIVKAFEILDRAHETSPLPVEPVGEADLEAWLITFRKRSLSSAGE
jgi:hypothetical protein